MRKVTAFLRGDRRAVVGAAVFALIACAVLLAPVLAPHTTTWSDGGPFSPPSAAHPLGTNGQGQDVLSHVLYGGRTSLGMALVVGTGTTVISVVAGLVTAFLGGVADEAISLVVNVVLTIPSLPLIIVLAAFLPPGTGTIVLVLVATGWAFGARVVRSQALTLRRRDFVAAATVAGEHRRRTIFVEIMPNMASVIAAYFCGQVVFALTAGSALEFLGLGDADQPSWGTMLFWAQNDSALLQGAWWTFVAPGLGIALTASALALVNFAIDAATNPRLRVAGGGATRRPRGFRRATAVRRG
ncbi:ABC transporter permease [Streptosporangium sp. NPDC004379]|uniref:ABC transporter permease n=1 Tax=Streptosporangium sp. NPDC004379 TaxID=3366189 RepID=UPI0036CB2D3D